jgi:2-oxoglutarate ferredoxin oxidoreductase subunit gamma
MGVEILLSGFGGQGLMSLGKVLSKTAIKEGRYTSWFPSYGAEVRGGTAHCFVKIADVPIASPFIKQPDIGIFFNQPSLDRFEKHLKSGGLLILNTDLVNRRPSRKDIRVTEVALNKIALECGNIKVANTVALGVLVSLRPQLFKVSTVTEVLEDTFKKEELLSQNIAALNKGVELGKS